MHIASLHTRVWLNQLWMLSALPLCLCQTRWLPELQRVVAVINTSFSQNFSEIGCAGEVHLEEHEEYDKFSIQVGLAGCNTGQERDKCQLYYGWLWVAAHIKVPHVPTLNHRLRTS